MEFRDGRPEEPTPLSGPLLVTSAMQRYGERCEQLMRRLERLRQRLHDPGCSPACQQAMRERMAWLHGAIFAISSELDGSY